MNDKVLVCGSRTWNDSFRIFEALRILKATQPPFTVIHGAAKGADAIAGFCARRLSIPVEEYPADWNSYGKPAGYLRNVQMADEKPVLVLAFQKDKSKGTQMMIDIAQKRGIPVLTFEEPQFIANPGARR